MAEDDVPTEITGVIRHNEDASAIEVENDGYVPQEDEQGVSILR